MSGGKPEFLDVRRRARMDRIDAMPAELRACVNEYGLTIVDACVQLGITKARHIHHLVNTIRVGSVNGTVPDFTPRRAHGAAA